MLRVEDDRSTSLKYKDLEPVYTGVQSSATTARSSSRLSNKVDQEKISANLEDGVLTLTLPKAKHAQPRKIAIG